MNPSNVTSINSLHSIRVSLVIVDSLLLFSIVIGFVFCISFICISIGFRSCRSVLTLLSANSCVAGLIFNSVQLSNTLLLLRDDIHLTSSLDNQYCAIRSYSMHVSGSLLYYSFCVQAISRLFFVVFYKYTFLLTYHIHFILIAIQWTLSLLLPFSLLTSEDVQYQVETSQCFIKMKNVSQTLYGNIEYFQALKNEFSFRNHFYVFTSDDDYFNLLYAHCLFCTSSNSSCSSDQCYACSEIRFDS